MFTDQSARKLIQVLSRGNPSLFDRRSKAPSPKPQPWAEKSSVHDAAEPFRLVQLRRVRKKAKLCRAHPSSAHDPSTLLCAPKQQQQRGQVEARRPQFTAEGWRGGFLRSLGAVENRWYPRRQLPFCALSSWFSGYYLGVRARLGRVNS